MDTASLLAKQFYCEDVALLPGDSSAPSLASPAFREHLLTELRLNKVVAVEAPTGSGKNVNLPRHCRARGLVLVVTPQTATVEGTADYLATQGMQFGRHVQDADGGGQRRRVFGDDGDVITPRLLLNWLGCQGSRYAFGGYATVIFDEVHEYGVADFLAVQAAVDEPRDDFRVLLMSSYVPPALLSWSGTRAPLLKAGCRPFNLRVRQVLKVGPALEVAQNIVTELHTGRYNCTVLFLAGERDMEAMEEWVLGALPGLQCKRLWRKAAVPLACLLAGVSANVLFLCTDWVAHGVTIPLDVQDVIVTYDAWRQDVDGLLQRSLCSVGELLNMAGRGGRTCPSCVWFCGLSPIPAVITSPPTRPMTVCTVLSPASRGRLALATASHLERRGFGPVQYCCSADVAELPDTPHLARRVLLLVWAGILGPALLATGASYFWVFEDTTRLAQGVTLEVAEEACAGHDAAVCAYAAQPTFREDGSVKRWFGSKALHFSRKWLCDLMAATRTLPLEDYGHFDHWARRTLGLYAARPLGGAHPRVSGCLCVNGKSTFGGSWSPDPSDPSCVADVPDFIQEWALMLPPGTVRGSPVPSYNAGLGRRLPYGLYSTPEPIVPSLLLPPHERDIMSRGQELYDLAGRMSALAKARQPGPQGHGDLLLFVACAQAKTGGSCEAILELNASLPIPAPPEAIAAVYFACPTLRRLGRTGLAEVLPGRLDLAASLFVREASTRGVPREEAVAVARKVQDWETAIWGAPEPKPRGPVFTPRELSLLLIWAEIDRRRILRRSSCGTLSWLGLVEGPCDESAFSMGLRRRPYGLPTVSAAPLQLPGRPVIGALGDSTLSGCRRALHFRLEEELGHTAYVDFCGGACVLDLVERARRMPDVDVLLLCICGNDILRGTEATLLQQHVDMLCTVVQSKTCRLALLMGGAEVMREAPAGYEEKMAQLRQMFEAKGMTPQDMMAFEALPMADAMHFDRKAVLEITRLAVLYARSAGAVERVPGAFQWGRLWPQGTRIILLRAVGEEHYHPQCFACSKRATEGHLRSAKCPFSQVGQLDDLVKASNEHWGVSRLEHAELAVTFEEYAAWKAARLPQVMQAPQMMPVMQRPQVMQGEQALPPGWVRHVTAQGAEYFHHGGSDTTQWSHPGVAAQLPPGWARHLTPEGAEYFHHSGFDITQWSRPF